MPRTRVRHSMSASSLSHGNRNCWDSPVESLCGEVANCQQLVRRKTCSSKRPIRQSLQRIGARLRHQRNDPRVDCRGRFAVQLLKNDRAQQRLEEIRFPFRLKRTSANASDYACEHGSLAASARAGWSSFPTTAFTGQTTARPRARGDATSS